MKLSKLANGSILYLQSVWTKLCDTEFQGLIEQAAEDTAGAVRAGIKSYSAAVKSASSGVVNHFIVRDEDHTDESFRKHGNFVVRSKEKDLTYIGVYFHYKPSNIYYRVWIRERGGRLWPLRIATSSSEAVKIKSEWRELCRKSDGVRVLDNQGEVPAWKIGMYPFHVKLIRPHHLNKRRLLAWLMLLVSFIALIIEVKQTIKFIWG